MTEQEWLNGADPAPLFEQVAAKATERKLRLFAIAALKAAGHLDREGHRNCDLAADFADGSVTVHALRAAWPKSQPAGGHAPPELAYDWADWIVMAKRRGYYGGSSPIFKQALLSHLIREIFGNPFKTVSVEPGWLPPTVVALATAAYTTRKGHSGRIDKNRLAVLADALEEAGCDAAEVLGHLRGPGPHVRGCWVLDLLLARS